MKKGLISVIVPTYNYGLFLNQCLDSVKNQTYDDWECIVVDDGSTDDTKSVVSQYVESDDRFRYIEQANKGVSVARNKGISMSNGEFIQFLDADDFLDERKFEIEINYLNSHQDIDLVFSNELAFSVDTSNQRLRHLDYVRTVNVSGDKEKRFENILKGTPFGMDNPIFRSVLLSEVSTFDEDVDNGQDWLFWFHVVRKNYSFGKVDDVLINIRLHDINQKKRNYVQSQRKIRQVFESYELSSRNKYISDQWKYRFIVNSARENKDYFIGMYFVLGYFTFAFPNNLTDLKIFVGDHWLPKVTRLLKAILLLK